MYTFIDIATFVVQLISTVVAVASTIIAAIKAKSIQNAPPKEYSTMPYGYKEVLLPLKWIMRITFVVYFVATCIFLCLTDVPDIALVSTIATFVAMLIGFIIFATLGHNSLQTRNVVAPKNFWQMLFNRIPSYLEECDGPFVIKIVTIGVKEARFAFRDEVTDIENAIEEKIAQKINQIQAGKEGQTFRGEKKPLYNITFDNDLFYHRSDHEKIHAIIVFVGNELSEQKVSSKIYDLADKFPDTAIGYLSYGSYPSDEDIPPFVNLASLRTEDYIDHLIFRSLSRSREWKRLSEKFHRAFVKSLVLIGILCLSVPSGLIIRNHLAREAMLLSVPEDNGKTDLTRMVDYLLVAPQPSDVKLWEKKCADTIVNIYRFSEGGDTSKSQRANSLINTVLQAEVFLFYDVSQSNPYIIWTCGGERCKTWYHKQQNAVTAQVGDSLYTFKWVPSKKEGLSYDDRRVRLMYSYDDTTAVEVIYAYEDRTAVRWKAKYSNTFLLNIQRFLVAANMISGKTKKEVSLKQAKEEVVK